MATAETIQSVWHAQPFQPFTLRLADGTEYEVKGREWISMPPARHPRELLYYVAMPDDAERFQHRWIDLARIAEVIVPSSANRQPGGNGVNSP
jgi:hypothetical protein